MKNGRLNKKEIEALCKSLGEDYSIRSTDWEQSIVRRINKKYEIEISRLDAKDSKVFGKGCSVFLWDLADGTPLRATILVRMGHVEKNKKAIEDAIMKLVCSAALSEAIPLKNQK